MITEDYVSFETAKLLKEKGFDAEWVSEFGGYYVDRNHNGQVIGVATESEMLNKTLEDWEYLRPTLQMAMKWLREVHNLECDISFNPYSKASKEPPYWMSISTSKFDNPYHSSILWKSLVRTHFDTYEEACEAAIKYCLENLI
jgi:hypothetical protein